MKLNKFFGLMAASAIVSTVALSTPAMADVSPYVGLRGGFVHYDADFNQVVEGYNTNVDVSDTYSVAPYFGLSFPITNTLTINTDLEYFYNGKNSLDLTLSDGNGNSITVDHFMNMQIQGLLLNAYLQYNVNSVIAPYAGVGIGESWVKFTSDYDDSASDSSFSCQGTLGLQLNVTKNFAFDVNVRYMRYSSDVASYNAAGGFKVSF